MLDKSLRVIALGGLGEFGLNALVLECEGEILLVDAGVQFASAEMPGVDSIVPDFAYLSERADRVRGILLTHGHEDHIGALAFALQAAPAPVYGSRLTLEFARRRLRERDVGADLRTLQPDVPVEIGPFRVHPIRVAHSVLDSLALAIETPAGLVVTSGDFKIDANAKPEERTDLAALARFGEQGVLLLLADSTNAETPGYTGGEDDVIPAFEEVLARARGKVVVSCFATSIPRLQRVAELAIARGRAIAFAGRRMIDNALAAQDLGLLRIPEGRQVTPQGAASLPPASQLVFASGSQGEPLSALAQIALGEREDVSVGLGDTVVLSARVIPGNERAVSRLIGNLMRRGCEVVHPGTARVHVSGHGGRGDLAELVRLVRPRWLVPIHGEYRMLAQLRRFVASEGLLPADAVHVCEDGDVLEVSSAGAAKLPRVPAGRVLLDRSGTGEVEDVVVRDRRHLSFDGIVVPVVVLDRQTGRVERTPEIVTRGVLDENGGAELLEEAERLVVQAAEAGPSGEPHDPAQARERVRSELRRFFRRRGQRRPMVIPVVMEV